MSHELHQWIWVCFKTGSYFRPTSPWEAAMTKERDTEMKKFSSDITPKSPKKIWDDPLFQGGDYRGAQSFRRCLILPAAWQHGASLKKPGVPIGHTSIMNLSKRMWGLSRIVGGPNDHCHWMIQWSEAGRPMLEIAWYLPEIKDHRAGKAERFDEDEDDWHVNPKSNDTTCIFESFRITWTSLH